jgi:hypothetical protein
MYSCTTWKIRITITYLLLVLLIILKIQDVIIQRKLQQYSADCEYCNRSDDSGFHDQNAYWCTSQLLSPHFKKALAVNQPATVSTKMQQTRRSTEYATELKLLSSVPEGPLL